MGNLSLAGNHSANTSEDFSWRSYGAGREPIYRLRVRIDKPSPRLDTSDKPPRSTPVLKGSRTGTQTGLRKTRRKPDPDGPPPTPWGCEWRPTDDGWSLWRSWAEKDAGTGSRVRKSRYAGALSREAWAVMKDYDYETFLANIGQQFRRHGKR